LSETPLVEARGLTKHYPIRRRMFGGGADVVRAVDDVSFALPSGTTVGLVGESGCGKSTLGRILLALEKPTSGEVRFAGRVVDMADRRAVRRLRREIQIIFQDPYSSLNPRQTVRGALEEVLRVHELCPPGERRARVDELLERVGLDAAMGDRRPHEFSGGQRQRIVIARALAVGPRFIVADEAVSALDVSIRAQILNLLVTLQDDLDLTYLFISHDLGVVRHMSTRIVVMYLGRVVEEAGTAELFDEPLHPYTQALLAAVPSVDADEARPERGVEGDLPSPLDPPTGCHFHPRCPFAMDRCRSEYPATRKMASGRTVACHLYGD
jgi:oligopeptide/dipeptide ABC transporter ATP-binding protein